MVEFAKSTAVAIRERGAQHPRLVSWTPNIPLPFPGTMIETAIQRPDAVEGE